MITTLRELYEVSLPLLRDLKTKCKLEHPRLTVSHNCEQNTFYISVIITDAPPDKPDLVDLTVDIRTPPGITIDVVWGDGDGTIEREFQTNDLSEASFADAYRVLTEFLELQLKVALRGSLYKRK